MSRSSSAMSSPALRLVIEPHNLKHSSNISLLIARHTFEASTVHQWKRARLLEHKEGSVSAVEQPLEQEAQACEPESEEGVPEEGEGSVSAVEQPLEQEAQACEPESEEGVPEEGEGSVLAVEHPLEQEAQACEPESEEGVPEEGEGSVSAVEQPLEQEAQACEPESEEGVPEEGEARAELPTFGLETMGKSPDVGQCLRPLVSRQKLTIPDLCLFDKKGRVLFVIEVCII